MQRIILLINMFTRWFCGLLCKPLAALCAAVAAVHVYVLQRGVCRGVQVRGVLTALMLVMLASTSWAQTWIVARSLDYTTAANTTAGGAGSTTGASLGGVTLTDLTGNIWSIQSGALQAVSDTGGTYPQRMQLRFPAGDSYDAERVVFRTVAGASQTWAFWLRQQTSTNNGIVVILDGTNSTYGVYAATSSALAGIFTGSSGALSTTYNAAHQYDVDYSVKGLVTPTVNLTITDVNTSTVVASIVDGAWTANQNAAATNVGGYALAVNRASQTSKFASVTTYYQGAAITTALKANSIGQATASVSVTVFNGTAPYTYQWHRSTTSGFTPSSGTAISGATSATLNDTGLTSQTTYYYKCVVGDAASATATSSQIVMTTQPASFTTIVGCQIGDSLPASTGSGSSLGGITTTASMFYNLAGYPGLTVAAYTNQAVPGTTTSDWQSGGANAQAAINAACAIGANLCVCEIGTNNSKTAARTSGAQFLTDITNIATWANAAGMKIVFHYPPWIDLTQTVAMTSWDSTSLTLLQTYATQIAALTNNTTIFTGATGMYAYFQSHASYLIDGVHPTGLAGVPADGRFWAQGIAKNVFGVTIGTYPAASNVLTGVQYGPNNNDFTGTAVSGGGTFPTAAQVLSGVTFGPTNNLTGNVVLPTAAQVLASIAFGAASGSTGTVILPTTGQVTSGVTFGPGGSLTGTATAGGGGSIVVTVTNPDGLATHRTISWNAVSGNTGGYDITRVLSSDRSNITYIGHVAAGVTTINDTTRPATGAVIYRVAPQFVLLLGLGGLGRRRRWRKVQTKALLVK